MFAWNTVKSFHNVQITDQRGQTGRERHLQVALEAEQRRHEYEYLGHPDEHGPVLHDVEHEAGADHAAAGDEERQYHLHEDAARRLAVGVRRTALVQEQVGLHRIVVMICKLERQQ